MKGKYSVPLSKIIRSEQLTPVYLPKDPEEILIYSMEVNRPGLILARYDNNFLPERIELLGNSEYLFLRELDDEARAASIDRLMREQPAAIIFSIDFADEAVQEFIPYGEKYDVPILKTAQETSFIMSSLVSYLNVELAERQTVHGVLVEVSGEGVLIMGESGVGKSETVVELIRRGNRLVADDAVEVRRVSQKTLVGSAPENIRHFMELRGIGIIDARRIFGMGSVKMTEKIDLVINLEPWDDTKAYERMGLADETMDILGLKIPMYTIPVNPGRNLAIIIEVAAINYRLKKMGHNSAKELLEGLGMNEDAANIDVADVDTWHSN
ncbi:MAG: HPr(Ser) kinase/phosphatase [Acutalibacteraceae bacterium]|nr:HPr(Ser) kinase/phosphatase [Clostridia bacterium]MBQ5581221.1 HPr(Ser) kinase/phosphatase [Clostridia bacterium]MEE1293329.1 HPr(Ser) kinase/phosphatase [Acutalibacteraceae bacterium]MEE3373701.1 HPr(Ser) kinase/phosphatase [Acutalibacteraceae bacterium]NLD29674.1 HPr(Ser) kinase/phosphatase [Clostridiales bacterium]